jgi:hypothetical protein
MFENKELRRVFGPKKEEVAGGWRRQQSEELHNLYTSQNIIKEMKSSGMGWDGIDSSHRRDEKCIRMLVGKLEGKKPLGNIRGDGMIIFEQILGKYGGKVLTEFI